MNSNTKYNPERYNDGDAFNEKESYQTPLIFRDPDRERQLDDYAEVMEQLRQKIKE